MKEEQESNLEETLIISIIAVLAVFFRFIIESDLSLALIMYILIFSAIIIIESVLRPLSMRKVEPLQKEPVQHTGKELPHDNMKKIYVGAGSAFVLLVTFYVWAHSFTHTGIIENISQYSEHLLMGGTALIFLWIVCASRKREEVIGQKP